MRRLAILAAAALLASACSQAGAESDAAFGQRVRAYLVSNPEVLEEAFQALEAKRETVATANAAKAIAQNRRALVSDARDPVLGRPDAKITVVEFFDYRCGFCKSAAPEVLALAGSQPDVRFVMKELPILADRDTGQVGVSAVAARVALLAKQQGKYPAVHRALMAERALDGAGVQRIAEANGVNMSRIDDPALGRQLADVHTLAQAIGVDGTPAFIVGDTLIPGADLDALQKAIDAERKKT